ncbi:MAG: SAM-dependent methyltransferase [Devosia sp.]
MVKKRIMSTARGVALVRAVEMTRPDGKRISSDPYARSFVKPFSVFGLRLMQAIGLSRLIGIEPMLTFAIVREQFVEDIIVAEARAGIGQVVVLGAGFDTRAYRIPQLAGVPVYEVDHPVTQAQKRAALKGVVTPFPANVQFVGVDFETDDLGERLRAAGYREHLRTLFVWQGVSMYLTQAGIDRTLSLIAQHSAAGSAVVFDYFDARAMQSGEATLIRFFTAIMGEKVTFAIDQTEIVSFLTARGFTNIRNADGRRMAEPYLTGGNAGRPMAKGVNVVVATVA